MQWGKIFLIAATLVAPAAAGQFEFSTLIRWGATGNPAVNWELAVGSAPGVWSSTGDATPSFAASSDRLFQVDYVKATNTATLSLYGGSTTSGSPDTVSFNPVGGASVVPTIWTLPASSFFVQAVSGLSTSQIKVQNLSLVNGVALSPLQSTPLTASQTLGLGAGIINPGGDFMFLADASGNWKLQGTVTMTALGVTSTNSLAFGITANASDVPEPISSLLIGLGLVEVAVRGRNQWTHRSPTS